MLLYKSKILLDDKGRIVIPQKIREEMELVRGSVLEINFENGIITLENGEKKENENEN